MKWYKSKTNWTCFITAITAVAGMLTGTIEPVVGIQTIAGCIAGIFMRQGVEKSGGNK